ncbi:tRNA (guanosine(46)-N7)-methyltransferase TrmB [Thioflexithrix psekupsensis]|uniref:tRNA (guanine-N(7)-)-methyltransferase n=1 Tax=Thioflexithrix psekupsensis TaxID=1570016 RepID=A0A251X8Z4_9GAMM|nr:tRNA (guanosine(46)-N7)-methyltransferase TrmB [Thioflexithrix psekupsensis]OUD14451.1 tRNA (guanosine(46)-N7)-methyltransferase TrmB [Thioflexithrix psekupsensis]
MENIREIRSFVRRNSRTTDAQRRALQHFWSQYGIDYQEQILDLNAEFQRTAPKHIEIGFGRGDALHYFACHYPECDFLGIDIHLPGAGRLLQQLSDDALSNVRVMTEDAVKILTHCIAPNSIERFYVLFPDPWPKKRHLKRRLIQADFVALIASRLKVNGEFYLATDWEDYAYQMLNVLEANACFQNKLAPRCFLPRWRVDRPLTKFEQRGQRLGHGVWDLCYVKREKNWVEK